MAYLSSSSFVLSSSLVASSLADQLANGADSGQKKPVPSLAQAGWCGAAVGPIMGESQTDSTNAHRNRTPLYC